MKVKTVEDIIEARKAFEQEYQRGIANFDWILAEFRRQAAERSAAPAEESFALIWSSKDATKVILDQMKPGEQFLRRDVFLAAKKLQTRIPVTEGAVNNALDKFEEQGIIRTIKPGRGPTPGIYAKAE